MKVLSGIALFTIYTYYYTDRGSADIYKYFDDASVLFQLAKDDFSSFLMLFLDMSDPNEIVAQAKENMLYWDKTYNYGSLNDNRTIIRVNTLFHFVSFGNFQVHNILFNVLSFTGCIGLYHFFRAKFKLPKWILLLSLFLVPSFLFWSSGVLKESILIFALGLTLFHFFVNTKSMKWLWLVLTFTLLLWIKTYVLLTLLPGLLFIGLNKVSPLDPLWNWIACASILIISVYLSPLIGGPDPVAHLIQKQKDFFDLVASLQPNSTYYLPEINSFSDVFWNLPRAVFSVLFRPFAWEFNGALDALAAMENLALLVLVILAVVYRKKDLSIKKWNTFHWSFILCLAGVIGLVTPVFGALVRYKVPLLPFLIIAMFAVMDLDKLYRTFPFINKLKNL
ncbi:MAG: hypothetical protein HKN39_01730 [Flavobacteriales bacterium]|nr:hypothetical protein [Flavobacteriales bacterium]